MEAEKESKKVKDKKRFCQLPKQPQREFPDDILPRRAEIIIINGSKWVNGTQLHYCFWDHNKHNCSRLWTASSEAEKDVVRESFQEWKAQGIGLEFIEVEDPRDAEVRIGFMQNDGSWSYIGTTVLRIGQTRRTMNFGWSLTSNWYGKETALHEIGHTLGFPHAHQNPKAGITWNEARVYEYFRGAPNFWDDDTIHYNILRKIPDREVEGTNWDASSIMQYDFDPDMIDAPPPYDRDGIHPDPGLSPIDKDWVKQFYPSIADDSYIELKPWRSHPATLSPGDQLDFIIRPESTRRYTMQTFGEVDTLLVLFEKNGNDNRFLAGDDDGGFDRNARITYKLFKNREYILRLRFYFSSQSGDTAVMMW